MFGVLKCLYVTIKQDQEFFMEGTEVERNQGKQKTNIC